jgi:hypothetical protein
MDTTMLFLLGSCGILLVVAIIETRREMKLAQAIAKARKNHKRLPR